MTDTASDAVTLEVGGVSQELPVVRATEGNDGIVVSSLLRTTGKVTVDPGFMNTASCESQITYIDGDEGILRYRGYPIEQLAEQSTFLEVAYLLIHGALPTAQELAGFEEKIARRMVLDERLRELDQHLDALHATERELHGRVRAVRESIAAQALAPLPEAALA